jgi:hypothetical protein
MHPERLASPLLPTMTVYGVSPIADPPLIDQRYTRKGIRSDRDGGMFEGHAPIVAQGEGSFPRPGYSFVPHSFFRICTYIVHSTSRVYYIVALRL